MKQYDAQYDFPDEIKEAFFESVRGDYRNDVWVEFTIEPLDKDFEDHNLVVTWLLNQTTKKSGKPKHKLGDEILIKHWW